MSNNRYSKDFKNKLLVEHNICNLSIRVLSEKYHVPLSTLYRWIKHEKDKQAETEKKLQRVQTQLTYINTLLMRAEITEKQYKILPSFSQTNIYPAWINFYHIPLQTLELLALKFLLQVSYGTYNKELAEEYLKSIQKNPQQVVNFIDDLEKEIEESQPSQKEINEFVDELRKSEDEDVKEWLEANFFLLHTTLAILYNNISIMLNNASIHELLYSNEKPSRNNIRQAIKVDKTLLGHPFVLQEIANRQLDGSTEFFDSLGQAVAASSFKGRRGYPRAYLALNMLEREGLLKDGRFIGMSSEKAFKIIHQAGFFLPKDGPNTVNSFLEKIVKKYFEQKHT